MLLLAGAVEASSYDRPVSVVRIGQGAMSMSRVSLKVGNHGSPCPANPAWFAYKGADTGLGKVWTAAAMDAYSTGRALHIQGNGL